MNKSHNIETLKDVIEIINEKNIKCFLVDFENWLRLGLTLKKIAKESPMIKRVEISKENTFKWTDDNKNDINLSVKIINEQ